MNWVLLAYIITLAVIVFLEIVLLASEWSIFTKADEKGWKALIPFYKTFVSHHIVGMSHIWFILEMIIWVFETFVVFWFKFPIWLEVCTLIFTIVFTFACHVVHVNKLCNCFGKGKAFKVGMFFVPFVFQMILAFGPAKFKKR